MRLPVMRLPVVRLQSLSGEPVHYLPYKRAGAQGGTETAQLPVLQAKVEMLPPQLDAIVCTGDLQGVGLPVQDTSETQLLGEVLADELPILLEMQGLPAARTGVLLAGDLYSSPQADRRGASGDVRRVWEAFRQNFRWVAGVAGNHDQIGSTPAEFEAFIQTPNLHYLDGACRSVDGLTLAGISGIIGNPSKPQRRSPTDFAAALTRISRTAPDIIALHQAPAVAKLSYLGSTEIGSLYEQQTYPLTICGHVSWPSPLAVLENGNQILNVDSRVVILRE